MYACIVFFLKNLVRLRITLTAQRTAHFMWVGVARTNAADSSIAHTQHGRKGNTLKRRPEQEREARQNESEIQKSKVGCKNNY